MRRAALATAAALAALTSGGAVADLRDAEIHAPVSFYTLVPPPAGINQLDLRGQGPSRTLVLINGRRQVSVVPKASISLLQSFSTAVSYFTYATMFSSPYVVSIQTSPTAGLDGAEVPTWMLR